MKLPDRDAERALEDKRRRPLERDMFKRARRLFMAQKQIVQKAVLDYFEGREIIGFTREITLEDIWEHGDQVAITAKLFTEGHFKAYVTGTHDALERLNKETDIGYAAARVKAKDMTLKFANKLSLTTERKLRKKLADGIQQGLGAADLSKSLAPIFDDTPREVMIARTETTKAYSLATADTYGQEGVKKVEWLTAQDDFVRPSHVECEIEGAIKLGSLFPNGLRWPGDPTGSAGQVINCRCTLLPVIEK